MIQSDLLHLSRRFSDICLDSGLDCHSLHRFSHPQLSLSLSSPTPRRAERLGLRQTELREVFALANVSMEVKREQDVSVRGDTHLLILLV